jgi:methionine-rich copper-binding protein CopC
MSTRISSTGLKVVTVGLLAMLASMLGVGTAGAHSAVVGSNPENGASIQVPPDNVSVSFNEALQAQFAALTVTGPGDSRDQWSKGEPSVEGATVSVDLGDLGPAGVYTIAYRVTSADGHPVQGTLNFTLTEAGPGTPVTPAASAGDSSSSESSSSIPVWGFILAGVVVFGGALFFVLRKPKSS